jgi:hypothetical protein
MEAKHTKTPLAGEGADARLREIAQEMAAKYRVITCAGRNGGYEVVAPGEMGGKTVFGTRSYQKALAKRDELNRSIGK